jgi:hypothetical protein
MTTFDSYDSLDDIFMRNGINSYHIEVLDNGVSYNLRLVLTKSEETADVINLDYRVDIDSIDPRWYNFPVRQIEPFNPDDWSSHNPQVIEGIKKHIEEQNSVRLIDFLTQHNERRERLDARWLGDIVE